MKRRVLNKNVLIIFALVNLLAVLLFKVPGFIRDTKLTNLGYDDNAIKYIKKYNLASAIISNEYYSDYLKQEIVKPDFKKDYYKLYLYCDRVNDDTIEMLGRLRTKGYDEETSYKILGQLKDYEIYPLLVFDLQSNIDGYVADCKNHASNNKDNFNLTNNYRTLFSNITTRDFSYDILINQNNAINTETVTNLVPMPLTYATAGLKLESIAYDNFKNMVNDMKTNSLYIYASSAFRSYDEQKAIYDSYEDPDANGVSRPGHSEFNTGLTVQIVASSGNALSTTAEYQWLLQNAHKYGFILRYPEGKSYITGMDYISNVFRYVGTDAASICFNKGLCYEEYYAYYVQYKTASESTK
jgi:D-alanyl-D-alanine carboxypeptidase